MRFTVYLNFVLIYFHVTGASTTNGISDYLDLIKFIRAHYSASSVIVLHPDVTGKDLDDLVIQNMIFGWARLFHREQILTACGTYKNVIKLTKHYERFRPLIIVFIPGHRAVREFANHARNINMSSFIWFLIFVPSPRTEMHHCYHPVGNMFNLMLDTEMLVMCRDDPVIREWYSVDGKNTETSDFLKWRPREESLKFEILTNLSIYDRRSDLRGRALKAVTVKNAIFPHLKNGKLEGYVSNIINDLQKLLNFTIDTVIEDDIFGTYNETTGGWTGAFGRVASGKVDISVSAFSMTNIRLGAVDFTIPIATATHYIYVKRLQVMAVKWFAYYRAFSFSLWMSIIIITAITPFLTTLIRSRTESANVKQLIIDEFLRIWSVVCQQGITDIPHYWSLRVAYLAVLIASIVMTAAYSGSLISFLTGSVRDAPFRTIDEFLNDGSYQIIVERGTSDYDMLYYSSDSLSERANKILKPLDALPRNIKEAFQQICNDPKVGFYTAFKRDMMDPTDSVIPCKVNGIEFGRIDSLCLILPKHSQYTSIINYHLQKLMNSGLVNRRKVDINFEEQTKFKPVGIFSAASALIIFAGGAAMALIVFILELCYYNIHVYEVN